MLGEDGGEVSSLLILPAIVITVFYRQKYNLFTISHLEGSFNFLSFFELVVSIVFFLVTTVMATKIKGIYKGFKFITQIFVVKEREMEIGYPTDVKHVAHIGWDGPSGNAPSWMNEFKTGPDFQSTSIGNNRGSHPTHISTWSSQDLEGSMGCQPPTEISRNLSCSDIPSNPKKQKRKKKSTSSPKSSSKSSRKSKATYTQLVGSSADKLAF